MYTITLCEKCPNTELFLVRIFLYSDTLHAVSGPFFQNQSTFFNFQKRAGEAFPFSLYLRAYIVDFEQVNAGREENLVFEPERYDI